MAQSLTVTTTWKWVEPYLVDGYQPIEANKSIDKTFCLYLNESYGAKEVFDTISAMRKVAKVFEL